MLKKIIAILTFLILISSFLINNTFAGESEKTYFRITAYYSPLPNQTHYIMGDYKKELRMNGKGIRGASGKKVFSGMIAAPSKYSFGTKIKLKGLGVAEVADRGGAIVKAGERNFKYDRIDIWVGHGEEGLQRAMYWGNRIIEGKVISKNSKNTLNINSLPAPRWAIYSAEKNPDLLKTETVENKVYLSGKKIITNSQQRASALGYSDIFSGPITDSAGVKKLQEMLKTMKLYSGEINGEYSNIREVILNFQLENKVISKNTDIGSGNFGPKTRKILKQKYNIFLEEAKKEKTRIIEEEKQEKIKKEKAKKIAEERIKNIGNIKIGDISHEVRQFQIVLKELGYFEYKDTAIFGEKTRQSILKYQLDKKLISSSNIYGAGMFGPKIRKSLIKDLSELK
ncbi:MAG: hypothetical protein Q9M94_02955 [Candidatus Gracilibacteria bacterium]|nr:hypothetical protein [Candidatus Gracilibacteria bacterium]MDQ7022704.1 hypothetical protein [Candidatus Gracilibacteria bacterium]